MGAALVAMVAELTIGRPDAAPHEQALRELRDGAVARLELLSAWPSRMPPPMQAVVTARRLPKETEEQRAARGAELGRAMVAAAEVPLRTAEVAAEVLDLAHADRADRQPERRVRCRRRQPSWPARRCAARS